MSGSNTSREKPSALRRYVFWGAIVLALLIGVRAYFDHHYLNLYQEKVDEAIEAGRFLPPESLDREPLPADENAMTYLREAAAPLVERRESDPDGDPAYVLLAYTPEIWKTGGFALSETEDQMVSFGIAAASASLKQLRESEEIPAFALWGLNGEDNHASDGNDIVALSVLGRYAAARAWWESSRGNVEGACRWISSAFSLAERLEGEPMIISAMVRVGIGQNALTILKDIMDHHDLPPSWREELTKQVSALRQRDTYTRALAAEAGVNSNRVMENVAADRGFWNYLTRPLARRYICTLLDAFDGVIGATREHDTARRIEDYAELVSQAESSLAMPNLLRSAVQFEDSVARCNMILIAMALKRYKADQGAYPDGLAALAPDYMDELPTDPHAEGDFAYTREEEGFMLYSAGVAWLPEEASEVNRNIVCRFDS